MEGIRKRKNDTSTVSTTAQKTSQLTASTAEDATVSRLNMTRPLSASSRPVSTPSPTRLAGRDLLAAQDWSAGQVWMVLALCRSLAALGTGFLISDCDETFNYWEPTHYLQYGYGLQTWEYAPVYGLRSWLYIGIHAFIGHLWATLSQFLGIYHHSKVCWWLLLRLFRKCTTYCISSLHFMAFD